MGKKRREIPIYDKGLIETHCHLDYLKESSLEEIISKSSSHGIEKIITIAVEPANLKTVRDISSKHENIFGTQGVHPHEAKLVTEEVLNEIRKATELEKIVAVGEIGLDYHYDHSPRETQIKVFEQQLQIAVETDMPVVIHTREADEDTTAVLKNFSSTLKQKGVIHSFTSGLDLAKFCINEGFHLGFNGIITFNKAQNVRDILLDTPIERVLVETDAPFLTPVPYRGRENAPFYLPFIAEHIATVKEIDLELVLDITKRNALDVFSRGSNLFS